MTARVGRPLVLALLALVVAGCGNDNTSQLSPLVASPSAAASPSGSPVPERLLPCDGALGNPGDGSTVTITGPCTIAVNAKWECSAQIDDMYAQLQGQLANGTKVYLSVNVEFYKKPGTYPDNVHIFLQLGDANGVVDSWSDYHGAMTVNNDVTATTLPRAKLDADPGTATPNHSIFMEGAIACHPPSA